MHMFFSLSELTDNYLLAICKIQGCGICGNKGNTQNGHAFVLHSLTQIDRMKWFAFCLCRMKQPKFQSTKCKFVLPIRFSIFFFFTLIRSCQIQWDKKNESWFKFWFSIRSTEWSNMHCSYSSELINIKMFYESRL